MKRNLTDVNYLQKIVNRYRKRLGINPSYIVKIEIVPDITWNRDKSLRDSNAALLEDTDHPKYTIQIRKNFLEEEKDNYREVTQYLVHELLHIIFGEVLKDLKRNYSYDQDGMIEEKLVMQMARAIVLTKD